MSNSYDFRLKCSKSKLLSLFDSNGQSQSSIPKDENIPYVVLLGDVGTGKSLIVEKLTGERDRSSSANISFTRESGTFWALDGSMVITDTPGSDAVHEKVEHNIQIASALNFMPVSSILVVVRAAPRMDNVVNGIRRYAESLVDLEMDVVATLVTHMDTVTWTEKELLPLIAEELGMEKVIFSNLYISPGKLLRDIHSICTDPPYEMTVNHENFLRFFKINNNQLKIIRCANQAVESFKSMKREFGVVRKQFTGKENDMVDLLFEFNAWMEDQILVAQKNMAENNKFTFYGEGAANEAGHIANMTNQLRALLYEIRVETATVQSEHGVNEARRCPHCNEVWLKVEGCDGATTCGNRPSIAIDVRNPSFGVLGTFTFKWDFGRRALSIFKSGTKAISTHLSQASPSRSFGCGKSVDWKAMPIVELPEELKEAQKVTTDDVKLLPESLSGASNFNRKMDRRITSATRSMSLGQRPQKHTAI